MVDGVPGVRALSHVEVEPSLVAAMLQLLELTRTSHCLVHHARAHRLSLATHNHVVCVKVFWVVDRLCYRSQHRWDHWEQQRWNGHHNPVVYAAHCLGLF